MVKDIAAAIQDILDNPIEVEDFPVDVVPSLNKRRRLKSRFVKGPILWGWIVAISRLRTRYALPIALAIKMKADAERGDWVKLPASLMADLGVVPQDKSRALAELEKAGLIEVQRRKGRPSLVRLLPWEDRKNG